MKEEVQKKIFKPHLGIKVGFLFRIKGSGEPDDSALQRVAMPERDRTPAKITRPKIRGVFPRERFFRWFDDAGSCPVTWISAPAGSGKTTLAAAYVEEKKIPCLWYQVDEGDADVATFFKYLRLAAEKAAPRRRRPLPFLTPEYLPNLSTFTLRYFEDLFGRLKSGSIMVLDNYQTVPPESRFHDVTAKMGGVLPEGIRVIVISRRDPPPPWAGLRGRGLVKVLGWNDLRLTLEETAGIVPLKTEDFFSGDRIEQLHRAADGWIAGLVLMLESLKRGAELPDRGKLAPREILEYFGNEFFNQTDRKIRDFLMRTAWLPKISLSAAERLSGLPQAGRILADLNRNNTFTERQASVEPVYQYHPLFREFLLDRARETLSREDVAALRQQAGGLLEQEGQVEAAVALFQDLENWDAMRRIIMSQAASMVQQGRIGPLEAWLGSLPREVLENDPWLLYWMGICRLQVAPPQSRPWFEKAFEGFRSRGETAGICLSLWGAVHAVIYAMADFNPLDHWIGVLEDLGQTIQGFPSVDIELWFVSALFSALVYRQPQHPGIKTWEEKALSLTEKTSNPNLRIQTLATVALYRSTIGDFAEALMAIESIKKWSPARESTPLIQIRLKTIEAAYYKYRGLYAECLQAVSEGLDLSRTTGIALFAPMLCYHGATSALGSDDYPLAHDLIEQVSSARERLRPYDLVILHSLKTQEALFLGEYDRADLHIEKATQLRREAGFDLINGWCYIQNAYVRHVLGRPEEAEEFLARALRFAEAIHGRNNAYGARLAEAHFAFDQGREEAGLTALGQAFALGREGGFYSTWGPPRPSDVARLCRKALEAGIEEDYAREFIRRFRLVPDRIDLTLEKWPWPLKIYTLGGFELLKDGKPVLFSKKVQKKPLELLKAVIALGGNDVDEDRLTDMLWPEADGDRAHSALTTTLSRLRRLIGEHILEVRNGRVSLNPQTCWVDARAFETLIRKTDGASPEKGPEEESPMVEQRVAQAVDLYRGPFLAEEGFELYWALPLRERLNDHFLSLIERRGRSLEAKEQWEQAIACYQRGLDADHLAEGLYRRLMSCYQRLGDTVKAVQIYRRLKSALSSGLGVEPSPRTESLYRSLTTSPRI